MSPRPADIVVVPFTHWDREWYATAEELRFSLVELLDEVIEALERDPALPCFLLDGQAIPLEDYLEVRPERRGRVARLVSAGRLAVGPWYVQPDPILVSGEALVRNLALGMRAAEELGRATREGWLPDPFGHPAQLPQVLRGFGIETFLFMRGLGVAVEELGSEFWWAAPDGSRVLAHVLSETYSNAPVLAARPEDVALDDLARYAGLGDLVGRLAERSPTGVLLLLNGSDHLRLQPGVGAHVAALAAATGLPLRLGRLEDFTAAVRERGGGLREHAGELVLGRAFPILRGVLSARGELKRRHEAAEQLLEGRAERLAALALALGGPDLRAFLAHAWRQLLQNAPHDSICGCSIDPVHAAMEPRWAAAEQAGAGVARRALAALAARLAPPTADGEIPLVVVNPSPWPRAGRALVEVAPYRRVPLGARAFGPAGEPAGPLDLERSALLDPAGRPVPFRVAGRRTAVEEPLDHRVILERVALELELDELPPLGWRTLRLVPAAEPPRPPSAAARGAGRTLQSAALAVRAEGDGTLTVLDRRRGRRYAGLGRLLDQADAGDEYTFSPLAGEPEAPVAGAWRIERRGEALLLTGELRLPAGLDADRRARSGEIVACPIRLEVRLAPGGRRVEVAAMLVNRARDHRLRVAFPVGEASSVAFAESAFGIERRPLATPPADGWAEAPTPTHAQRRFVAAAAGDGGLLVLNRGLREYELAPGGELRLTLLRAVGWLSRDDLPPRPGHAGPPLPTPGAQGLGRHELRWALVPLGDGFDAGAAYREAEEYALPLTGADVPSPRRVAPGPRAAPEGSLLAVDDPAVVLSALKPADEGDAVILRVFNAERSARRARIALGFPVRAAWRAGLDERPLEELALTGGALELELPGARIETVRLELG